MKDKKTATQDKPNEIVEDTRKESTMITNFSPASPADKLVVRRAVVASIRSYISTLRPS